VVGNLSTVYSVGRERVDLAAKEKKMVMVYWIYPVDTTFALVNGPCKVSGASWGHELNVAWMDSAGAILDRGRTVFAIEQDGRPADSPASAKTESLTAAQAFDLRYCGYLHNPAYRSGDDPSVRLEIGGKPVSGLTQGLAPSGLTAWLARLPASAAGVKAVLTLKIPSCRLVEAWLLDPGAANGPQARRLYYLDDDDQFTFTIPACSDKAVLVMELMAGVDPRHGDRSAADTRVAEPLASMVAKGEKEFGPFRSLLQDVDGKRVTTPAQWNANRAKVRETIWKALGAAPEPRTTPFDPVVLEDQAIPAQALFSGVTRGYTRRKVSIRSRADERMNLWMLIPQGIGPFPVVVALHQTVQDGKDEPVGLGGFYNVLNFGPFLASRGYLVVAVDSLGAGERWDPETLTSDIAKRQKDPAWSLMGEQLRDHVRAVDYVETLPFADRNRIGTVGHSLGGQSAGALAAIDDRIHAAVVSCGFTLMRTEKDAADLYASPCSPPIMSSSRIVSLNFRKFLEAPVASRKLPFDFDDIMALWGPCAVYQHDVRDELWHNAAQVAQAAQRLQELYQFLGVPQKYYVRYSRQSHCFPAWVQPEAWDWLDYWLKGAEESAKPPGATR
jgi:dienelactone hydrolase